MEWTNARALELIKIYESEPVLWNPQDPNHRKKRLLYQAWDRIKANLSFDVTVEELRNKMKSLMAYYRVHLNKYKESLNPEVGDEVYETNWFAFSPMHSFLFSVYISPSFISTPQVCTGNKKQEKIHTEDSTINERPKPGIDKKQRIDNLSQLHLPSEIIEAKQQMEEAFQHIKAMNDEYEMFGKLIANKIRKLDDYNVKEIVMKDIYDVIFRAATMDQCKQTTSSCRQPSPNPSTSNSTHFETYYLSSPNSSRSQSPHQEIYHQEKGHKSSRKRMKYR